MFSCKRDSLSLNQIKIQMPFTETLLTDIQKTSVPEWIAVSCGVLYVILAAYRKIACWFFGLISSGIYVYLCFKSNLLIETGLQIFYIFMSVYGWISWHRQSSEVIKMRSIQFHLMALSVGLVFAFALGFLFDLYTHQASAYLDASIAVFSLVATFMTANRVLENWIYWIVVDAAAIFLYKSQGLALSALLYLVFTLMAVYGLIQWSKQYRHQKQNQNQFQNLKSNA
jgi:nicotinamide mononucleotide transporter